MDRTGSPCGTLAEVLMHHLEAGLVKRVQIELAARVSHTTVWRWVTGETLPDARQMADMLAAGQLPHGLQRDLAEWMLGHSAYKAVRRPESMSRTELDVNRDGRVNGRDALRHALAAQKHGVELAERVAAAIEDGRIDTAELAELARKMGDAAGELEAAIECARRDGDGQ